MGCGRQPGPVARRLNALYWSKREAGWHGTPVDYPDGSRDDSQDDGPGAAGHEAAGG